MADEKKDLTGILDIPGIDPEEKPAEEASAHTVEVTPTEKLDTFESMEELSQAAPVEPNAIDAVKSYSENLPVGQTNVPAAFPFSLHITGELTRMEKEKLIDLLSRENMGIREVDLEPQFEGGRVLIPRISEYAGVMIVQALRGAKAEIKLAPSDPADETAQTHSHAHHEHSHATMATEEIEHPAEKMPLTNDSALPNVPIFSVVGIVSASAALKTTVVEAERSAEYQEILEALQRELKYKAYRKGASAIVNFSVTLNRLTLPTSYRLSVMGTAVQADPAERPS